MYSYKFAKISFLFLSLTVSSNVFGTSFKNYYLQVNEAEELFVNNDVVKAINLYKKSFQEYKQPFVADCYKAAEIAYYAGDTAQFIDFLNIAFANGMPISALYAAPILLSIKNNNSLLLQINNNYSVERKKFSIDTAERDDLFYKSYVCDSLKVAFGKSGSRNFDIAKKQVEEEDKFRKFIAEKYLSKGIFPSEKLIGIPTDETSIQFREKYSLPDLYPKEDMLKIFSSNGMTVTVKEGDRLECRLAPSAVLNIFIHSTCTIEEYGNLLWESVLNGYMHPKCYGMLEEMCITWNRTSDFSKFSKICNYNRKDAYYNILNYDRIRDNVYVEDPELLKKVEANRAEHYMQKYSVDLKKKALEKAKGFKFFFGWGYYQ